MVYSMYFLTMKIALCLVLKKKQNILFWLIFTWYNPCHVKSKWYNCSRQLLVFFDETQKKMVLQRLCHCHGRNCNLSNLSVIYMFVPFFYWTLWLRHSFQRHILLVQNKRLIECSVKMLFSAEIWTIKYGPVKMYLIAFYTMWVFQ